MSETAVSDAGRTLAPWVVPLESIDHTALADAGAKAANLGEATRGGLPVPPGLVVTTRSFEVFLEASGMTPDAAPEAILRAPLPDAVADAVRAALASLGEGPLAVRSSGVEEDLPGASFAGQYETVLEVRGEDAVFAAILRCWASAFAPRVLAYRRSQDRPGTPRMAVLVQRMVQAETAGVAFTANPVTGDRDEAVVEAVRGLGEHLVSGAANADEWVVRGERAELRRSAEGAITADEARRIASLARAAEGLFRVPQDIEWASSGGRLFLLQARPITALPEPMAWIAPAPGAWLRNFRLGEWLGEPLTPLFETWLVERLDDTLWAHLHRVIHAPVPGPYHVVVNGYYYATANFLPKSRAGMLRFGLLYFLPGLLLRPRRVAIIFPRRAYWGMEAYEREWRATVLPEYEAAVRDAAARVETAAPEDLPALVDRVAGAAGSCFVHVTALAGSAWKPEYVLASFYREHLEPTLGGSHLPLVQGIVVPAGDLTAAAPSLDWYRPTLGEIGTSVPAGVPPERRARLEADRQRLESACRAALQDRPRLRRKFEVLLRRAQWAASLREEVVPRLTLGWPVMRRALLRIGAHLRFRGILASEEDVFFLTRDELLAAVRDTRSAPPLATTVARRRDRWEQERRVAAPLQLGTLSPLAQRLLGGFESVLASGSPSGGGLRGLPASPGRATGRVRVIRSVEDFDRFQEGDVLVAPATNPAWTPLFARAAAIVTDTGSLMAHASLVAREYGIPAVVGVGDATVRLRDGETVSVDGNAGSVIPV